MRIPSYRHHKPSGLGVVTLNGKDHYLGKYGSPESKAAYDGVIGRWVANGRRPGRERPGGPTVDEVFLAFYRHAETRYRKGGKETSRLEAIRTAGRMLRDRCGTEPAASFGPAKFKAVREAWIAEGLA